MNFSQFTINHLHFATLNFSLVIESVSTACIVIGIFFWFWGTYPLLGSRSVLFKLHSLSVADTLGSMAIIFGLLLKIPSEWSLLVLALISLAIWNTVLGYVLAYCSETDHSNPNYKPETEGVLACDLDPQNAPSSTTQYPQAMGDSSS